MIAVTPVTPPAPGAQHRPVQLISYDEFDLSQLVSATETNVSGLESVFGSSNWLTNPDISQGFTTLFSDLSSGTANPVTNPFSLLTELGLLLTSSGSASNAASTAATGVVDNIESALSSSDYSAALTDLENAPTTVVYAFLNGYPQTVGSDLLSPQLGLLTNTADGASTGTVDAFQQVSNTVADEVATTGGANLTTGSLPLLTGNLDLSVNLDQILSDLGLTSGGGPLTINGLLGDLGVSPTANILPSLDVGQVLGYLGLSDSSGISLGTILGDLGLSDTSSISLGTILGDLGLSGTSSISVGQVLSDPGLSDTSSISLGTILGDLGLSNSSSIGIPAISVGTILGDLGLSTSSGISLGTALGDLGINVNSGVGFETLVNDLVGNPSYTI